VDRELSRSSRLRRARRHKVRNTVRVPKGKRPDALRAIEVHEKGCPASQSVQRGIAVEWEGEVREDD